MKRTCAAGARRAPETARVVRGDALRRYLVLAAGAAACSAEAHAAADAQVAVHTAAAHVHRAHVHVYKRARRWRAVVVYHCSVITNKEYHVVHSKCKIFKSLNTYNTLRLYICILSYQK